MISRVLAGPGKSREFALEGFDRTHNRSRYPRCVASSVIQISTLNTEVDKGSATTAFDHGLVDPKAQGNSVN